MLSKKNIKIEVLHTVSYRLLFCLLLTCVLGMPGLAVAGDRLNILTSFPPKFYTPFIRKFELLHPDIQVAVLNKKTTSAIDEIMRGNERHFDIFWSSSADAFGVLKSAQRLRLAKHEHPSSNISMDEIVIDDPEGYFYGFALSGVGWMWNPNYLERYKLPIPKTWADMADPVYYGHIAMSTPSRSGTTHMIVENFLQASGWEQGWAQLLLMAGNLSTVTARSFGVPEGVSSGRFGIGLVIDFLAQTRIKSGMKFSYGQPVFLAPASIASLTGGKNPSAADMFIDFILSDEGQEILLQPEVGRLPVSSTFLSKPEIQTRELVRLIETGNINFYDAKVSRLRYQLVNLLFDRMITYKLRDRRRIWKKMVDLERIYKQDPKTLQALKQAVLKKLCSIPVSEAQSRDKIYLEKVSTSESDLSHNQVLRDLQEEWDSFINKEFADAMRLLEGAEKSLNHSQRDSHQ